MRWDTTLLASAKSTMEEVCTGALTLPRMLPRRKTSKPDAHAILSIAYRIVSQLLCWLGRWNDWLTDQSGEPLQPQESYIRLSEYPWRDLADGPVSFTFESDGEQARWLFKFTVSGTPNDGDIVVMLDGEPLDWTGAGTLDRTFYTFGDENSGLSAGSHTIDFVMGNPVRASISLSS